jgi:hypothetical protein
MLAAEIGQLLPHPTMPSRKSSSWHTKPSPSTHLLPPATAAAHTASAAPHAHRNSCILIIPNLLHHHLRDGRHEPASTGFTRAVGRQARRSGGAGRRAVEGPSHHGDSGPKRVDPLVRGVETPPTAAHTDQGAPPRLPVGRLAADDADSEVEIEKGSPMRERVGRGMGKVRCRCFRC